MSLTGVSLASVRLAGVDAARGVALIGMMTVHVLPGPGDDGGSAPVTSFVYQLAEGRSSALFAVLAGVSLVLAKATRAQIAVRALVVAAIGLSLGSLPGPIAIILTSYGVLFLVALPFVRLPAPVLAGLAVAWALLSPLASQWLRLHGTNDHRAVPAWSDLGHPVDAAANLLLTGYYPALTWLTYLLAGLAAGRVLAGRDPDQARDTGRWFALIGAVVALAGFALGAVAVRAAGGVSELNRLLDAGSVLGGRGDQLLDASFYGTTPITSWWWTLVDAPHSGAIGDLLQTTGSALVLLGLALMLARWIAMRIHPLIAAGAMTLTIYTLHVLIVDVVASVPVSSRPPAWTLLLAQVPLALAAARAVGAPANRGPLEAMVSGIVRSTAPGRSQDLAA